MYPSPWVYLPSLFITASGVLSFISSWYGGRSVGPVGRLGVLIVHVFSLLWHVSGSVSGVNGLHAPGECFYSVIFFSNSALPLYVMILVPILEFGLVWLLIFIWVYGWLLWLFALFSIFFLHRPFESLFFRKSLSFSFLHFLYFFYTWYESTAPLSRVHHYLHHYLHHYCLTPRSPVTQTLSTHINIILSWPNHIKSSRTCRWIINQWTLLNGLSAL
jgi:hypothetical protein